MDVEKTIRFILEQNAANTVQIQQLTAAIAELREATRQHTVHLEVHTEWKLGIDQALQDLAAQMKEGFDLVAQKHVALAEAQKTTKEGLNILIRTVQEILPRLPKQG